MTREELLELVQRYAAARVEEVRLKRCRRRCERLAEERPACWELSELRSTWCAACVENQSIYAERVGVRRTVRALLRRIERHALRLAEEREERVEQEPKRLLELMAEQQSTTKG